MCIYRYNNRTIVQKYLARVTLIINRRIMTWPTENYIIYMVPRHPSSFGNRDYLHFGRSKSNIKLKPNSFISRGESHASGSDTIKTKF